MVRNSVVKSIFLIAALVLSACATSPRDGAAAHSLKLNQIQVLGTHNSYSLGVDPTLMARAAPMMTALFAQLPQRMNSEQAAAFREQHPNDILWSDGLRYAYPEGLHAQLQSGVRNIELDVNRDPDGGRFLNPAGYTYLTQNGAAPESFSAHEKSGLDQPGFKVLHIADLDFRSSCNLLKACLEQLKAWSDAHSTHTPIVVLIEAKDQSLELFPNATKVLPFDSAAFDQLDAEILSVIPRSRIVAPDDVRGAYATLNAAVRAGNWPTLESAQGKFVFLLITALDAGGLSGYREGRPNLEGRVAFLQSTPGDDHAAFLLLDNALVRQKEIAQYVREGYLVRTRSDIETFEAKMNDMTRAEAAFASGAQIVTTDFYRPGNAYGTGYVVRLPGGGAWRCNPVNAQACVQGGPQ